MAADIDAKIGDIECVVGFSMGGYLALHHALTHPGRVSRLMIVAASAYGLGSAERTIRRKTLSLIEQHGYAGISRKRLAQMVHPTHLNDQNICNVICKMDSHLGQETLISQLRAHLERPSLVPQLPSLDIPVTIVGSAQDMLCAQSDLIAMAEHIPHASLHIIEQGVGHLIPLEAPEALAGHISDFFAT